MSHTITLSGVEHPILAFDTETSGTDALTAHIITWGTSSAENPEYESVLQLPDDVEELDDANVAVHGYTIEKIAEVGKDRRESLLEAFTVLDDFNEKTTGFIVGHNVVYDMTILHAELSREGFTKQAKKIGAWRVIDTFPLLESSDMIGAFKTSLKLNVIAEIMDVDVEILDNAHNAGADSYVAAALLEKMMDYFPHLGAMDAEELNVYMRETALRAQYKKMAIFEDSMVGYPVQSPAKTQEVEETKVTSRSPRKRSERKPTAKKNEKSSSRAVRRKGTSRSSRSAR